MAMQNHTKINKKSACKHVYERIAQFSTLKSVFEVEVKMFTSRRRSLLCFQIIWDTIS